MFVDLFINWSWLCILSPSKWFFFQTLLAMQLSPEETRPAAQLATQFPAEKLTRVAAQGLTVSFHIGLHGEAYARSVGPKWRHKRPKFLALMGLLKSPSYGLCASLRCARSSAKNSCWSRRILKLILSLNHIHKKPSEFKLWTFLEKKAQILLTAMSTSPHTVYVVHVSYTHREAKRSFS